MDTYNHIHFEVVQVGDTIVIRCVRKLLFRTSYSYVRNDGRTPYDLHSLNKNFSESHPSNSFGYSSLVDAQKIADKCQIRYGSGFSTKILYTTKPKGNFDEIHSLTLKLIETSKIGDDAAEKVILKQLEALHEQN